jgi:site-specific recombinase XerD
MDGIHHGLALYSGNGDKCLSMIILHTFATHLMVNGCELRLIQGMLGHAGPEMSARYAQVTARALVAAHRLYHPADGGDVPPVGCSTADTVRQNDPR